MVRSIYKMMEKAFSKTGVRTTVKPHGALDLEQMETPVEAYYRRMPPKGVLIDPAVLWGEMIS